MGNADVACRRLDQIPLNGQLYSIAAEFKTAPCCSASSTGPAPRGRCVRWPDPGPRLRHGPISPRPRHAFCERSGELSGDRQADDLPLRRTCLTKSLGSGRLRPGENPKAPGAGYWSRRIRPRRGLAAEHVLEQHDVSRARLGAGGIDRRVTRSRPDIGDNSVASRWLTGSVRPSSQYLHRLSAILGGQVHHDLRPGFRCASALRQGQDARHNFEQMSQACCRGRLRGPLWVEAV